MQSLPASNKCYNDVAYWDQRYRSEESFEWFGDLSRFRHLLEKHVMKEDKILVLGCGTSSLSSDLYRLGFSSITNVDYSPVCVDTMSLRHADCPGMRWLCMDARRLDFPNGSFDVVLEKGTLDAMMVEEKDPWTVSVETGLVVGQVLTEVSRVLRPGGRFLSITFAQPHFRKKLLARAEYGWSIQHWTYGETFHYFLYAMRRGETLSPEDGALGEGTLQPGDAPEPVRIGEHDGDDYLSRIDL